MKYAPSLSLLQIRKNKLEAEGYCIITFVYLLSQNCLSFCTCSSKDWSHCIKKRTIMWSVVKNVYMQLLIASFWEKTNDMIGWTSFLRVIECVVEHVCDIMTANPADIYSVFIILLWISRGTSCPLFATCNSKKAH